MQVCNQINDGTRQMTVAARSKAISRLINRRPTRALIILLCFDMDFGGSILPDANEGLSALESVERGCESGGMQHYERIDEYEWMGLDRLEGEVGCWVGWWVYRLVGGWMDGWMGRWVDG